MNPDVRSSYDEMWVTMNPTRRNIRPLNDAEYAEIENEWSNAGVEFGFGDSHYAFTFDYDLAKKYGLEDEREFLPWESDSE